MKLHQPLRGLFPNMHTKTLLGAATVMAVGIVTIGVILHSSASAQNASAGNPDQAQQAQQHLSVKEWGVQVPLPATVSDAYYVASSSTYDPRTGQPNTIWISLASLSSKGCDAAHFNSTGEGGPAGALIRVMPTDTDPVTGQLYTEKYPGGSLVGNYYYVYIPWKNKSCGTQTLLHGVDSAFGTAVKSMTPASGTVN